MPTPIDAIHPHTRNPRKIGKEALAKLCASIQRDPEFMRLRPIVVDAEGAILGGNQRWRACKKLGMAELPEGWVVQAADLTDEQRRRFILVDNAPEGMAGEWDDAILKEDWKLDELKDLGFEMDGMEPEGDADSEPQIDRAEELNQTWGVKAGDLWLVGEHRLVCGDSTTEEDVAKLMQQERADVVFTDPPYGVNIKGGKNNSTIAGDITQTAIPFSFEIACRCATTDDARLYFCGGEGNIGLYGKLYERYCRQLPRHLIWVKNGFTMKPNGYHNQYEIIFHGYKPTGGGLNKWYSGRKEDDASDVWHIKRDASATYLHPTQKPIEIPSRAIRNSCPPSGIVYEPFCGSGSTMVACERLGRKCRAIELSESYCAVILQRMADAFPGIDIRRG